MRAAVIFGLGSSEKDLGPFCKNSAAELSIGLPASSSEADAILIFGGDGTVHRHLPQLVKLQLPVLVVPCGSGNDFARALGLRKVRDAVSAWQKFSTTRTNAHAIDLGVIHAGEALHYFCCIGGVGLDAEVARRANRFPRWLRGHGGYVLSLLPALLSFKPVPLKISTANASGDFWVESNKPTFLAAFANTQAFGDGMKIAPRARMDDGLLDVCVIREVDKVKLFCLFPTVYFGRHLQIPEVEYCQSDRLRIETEKPMSVYADGEYVCETPIEVTVARTALRAITSPAQDPSARS